MNRVSSKCRTESAVTPPAPRPRPLYRPRKTCSKCILVGLTPALRLHKSLSSVVSINDVAVTKKWLRGCGHEKARWGSARGVGVGPVTKKWARVLELGAGGDVTKKWWGCVGACGCHEKAVSWQKVSLRLLGALAPFWGRLRPYWSHQSWAPRPSYKSLSVCVNQ